MALAVPTLSQTTTINHAVKNTHGRINPHAQTFKCIHLNWPVHFHLGYTYTIYAVHAYARIFGICERFATLYCSFINRKMNKKKWYTEYSVLYA